MRIGQLELKNPIITAPMAGISTRVYRDILRSYGAALVWGEMISAQALVYNNQRTFDLLAIEGEAFPCAVQLSGSKPEVLAEAAVMVESQGANIIDLNMGCPAPKVVRNGEGAKLMRDPQLCGRIMREVTAAVKVPVTAKIRLGWDDSEINCLEVATILQDAGAAAITIHGRTREQFYAGQADWQQLARIKQLLTIPVVGNGDIFSANDALKMQEHCSCDAVMIGRGMVGNPWLVRECIAACSGMPSPLRPRYEEIVAQALEHLRAQVSHDIALVQRKNTDHSIALLEGELAAVRAMRGQLAWYIKGMPHAATIRCRINQLTRVAEIESLFAEWLLQLGSRP